MSQFPPTQTYHSPQITKSNSSSPPPPRNQISNNFLSPANGRIPAIVDKTSGNPKPVFEGSSIQLYLTAKYDPEHRISFPYDSDEYWEVVEWMTWMQSGLGPMQGQANHFYRYAPTRMEYAINRYQTETKRLYQVLEERLKMQSEGGKKVCFVLIFILSPLLFIQFHQANSPTHLLLLFNSPPTSSATNTP